MHARETPVGIDMQADDEFEKQKAKQKAHYEAWAGNAETALRESLSAAQRQYTSASSDGSASASSDASGSPEQASAVAALQQGDGTCNGDDNPGTAIAKLQSLQPA